MSTGPLSLGAIRAGLAQRDDPRLPALEDRIIGYFAAQERLAGRAELGAVWRAAAELCRGGKYLRPLLFLAAYDALADDGATGISGPDLLDAALAVELLHVAFLLHDDVIDRDLRRRGRPNVIAVGAELAAARGAEPAVARHFGEAASILIGNALLSHVHVVLGQLEGSRGRRLQTLRLLEHVIADSITGELADVALAARIIPGGPAPVLEMTARKTATYSVEFPLRLAAVLADALPLVGDRLVPIAQAVGTAFQLQDDLLGVYGEPAQHGKALCGDLVEGKETLLVAIARESALWPDLAADLGRPAFTEADAARVRELFERAGARAAVQAEIDRGFLDAELGARELAAEGLAGRRLAEVLRRFIAALQGRIA